MQHFVAQISLLNSQTPLPRFCYSPFLFDSIPPSARLSCCNLPLLCWVCVHAQCFYLCSCVDPKASVVSLSTFSIRSYAEKSARSLQHSEAKLLSARSVLWWGTTGEHRVMNAFACFAARDDCLVAAAVCLASLLLCFLLGFFVYFVWPCITSKPRESEGSRRKKEIEERQGHGNYCSSMRNLRKRQ